MATSSASPSTSCSKKPLGIDPKPKSTSKPCPSRAPPNSGSSSSTAATPPAGKRTRDQPNFSDCHCCGRRINYTNPKDRLQPLDSVWRIILLCRKCRKKVRSGYTCSYCLQEKGNSGDLFKCSVCERKIHKDCARDYGNCRPWCYLGVGYLELGVCLDCWVPEQLKSSIRYSGRSENDGGCKDRGEAKTSVKNVVKGVTYGVDKEGQDQALRRLVAKSVVDLEICAFGLLSKKDKDGCNADNSNHTSVVEAVDDAELSIQLHMAMNSSPRISRSKCLVNKSASDVLSLREWKGLTYKRSGLGTNHGKCQKFGMSNYSLGDKRMNQSGDNGLSVDFGRVKPGLLQYKRDMKRMVWELNDEDTTASENRSSQSAELKLKLHPDDDRTRCSVKSDADIPEASVCVDANQSNSFIAVDKFGRELVCYKRTRLKRNICQVNGVVCVSGECSSCNKSTVAFKSDCCEPEDGKQKEGCVDKSDAAVALPNGSCDAAPDRYHLKYRKRVTSTKSDSSCLHSDAFQSEKQASVPDLCNSEADYAMKCNDELNLPNVTSTADSERYQFKYSKRLKVSKSVSNFDSELQSDAWLNENEPFAPGLAMNCAAKAWALSDVSLHSAVDLPK